MSVSPARVARDLVVAVVGLTLAAILCSGCTAGHSVADPVEGGPIGFGDDTGGSSAECAPIAVGRKIILGDVLQAKQQPLDLEAVAFRDANGFTVDASYAIPVDGTSFAVESYPSSHPEIWDRREAIAGAVVQPGQAMNVVFVVTRTGESASAGSIEVEYAAGGQHYVKADTTSFSLKDKCF